MIIFYSKVKFGPFYLCMGKHLRCRIPRNWWILWGESWYIQSNKWIHDNLWLLKVKFIHWPLSKVTQIQLFQSSFPQKPQGWLKQNFMESPWEVGNENLFHVTWPCPYMIKNFKNLLFPNQETGDLKSWYTLLGSWLPSIFSNDDPGLTWSIFMTGSDLFPNASIWVAADTALSAHV